MDFASNPSAFCLDDYALGRKVPKNVATHMEMGPTGRIIYFSLTPQAETEFLKSLARKINESAKLFYHECFSANHRLVFDLDAKWAEVKYLKTSSVADEIVKFLCDVCRDQFDAPPDAFRCIVAEAPDEIKMSFHVHFPFLVVDNPTYREVIALAKSKGAASGDGKQREIATCVDAHLCNTRKLRMVYSDKCASTERRPAGRPLRLLAAFNADGQPDPEWTRELHDGDPMCVLDLCTVRCNSNQSVTQSRRSGSGQRGPVNSESASNVEEPPHKRFRAEMDSRRRSRDARSDCDSGHSQDTHYVEPAGAHMQGVDASTDASSVFVGEITYDQLLSAIRSETLHELPEKYYRDLNAICRTVSVIRDNVFSAGSTRAIDGETAVLVHFMNLFCCAVTDQKGGLVYCIRTHKSGDSKQNSSGQHHPDYQRFHMVQKNNAAFLQYFESIRFPVETSRKGVLSQKTIAHIWLASSLRRNVKKIVFDPNTIRVNYEPFQTPIVNDDIESDILTPDFLDAHTHINAVHTLADPCVNLFDNVSMPVASALKRCLHESRVHGLDWRLAVEPILHHMRYVWCSGDERLFSFLMGWFKNIIFKPWEKTGVAVVLHGSEGCGKSSVITHIGRAIFGDYFYQVTDNEDLTGRFANSMADKLLVFLDEALWGGNKKDAGKVKALLTEKTVRVEFKGVDTYYVDNFSNFIVASNDIWLVPAGANARRWFCLECSSRYNRDTVYFTRLIKALTEHHNFGVAAFVTHLFYNVTLEQFTPHDMPITELLRIQKEMGLSVMETWWFQVLNRGFVLSQTQFEQQVLTDANYPHEELRKYNQVRTMFRPQNAALVAARNAIQCIPLEIVFHAYREEMYGGTKGSSGNVTDRDRTSRCIQRFFIQQNVWNELTGAHSSLVHGQWLVFDIQQAKDLWRIRYEDKNLRFNSDAT